MKLYYRLSKESDPEERLEDAALWKALHDVFGESITLLDIDADIPVAGGLMGRTRQFEHYSNSGEPIDYWNNQAFLNNCNREFYVADFNLAEEIVANLHRRGKDAFVKATQRKYYTAKCPIGTTLGELMDAMVYSFIDREDCLMVQEFCTMEYEQRFLFIGGELAAKSPIAWHLTPLDTHVIGLRHYKTPRDHEYTEDAALDLADFAASVQQQSGLSQIGIDCAWINGKPGVVEFNDFHIGQMGLYACDVRSIAEAIKMHGLARKAVK